MRPSAFAVLRLIESSNLLRLLDGQIAWIGPLQYSVHICGGEREASK